MPAQEKDPDMPAFQKWKKKWYKNYHSPDEEKARFKTFKENLLYSYKYHSPPPSSTLTVVDLLDDKADRPFEEHFGYFRLDRVLCDDNDDFDDEDTFLILVPVEKKKKDDGSHDEFVREKGSITFVVERRPRNAATVKPVKRTSDDTKEEDTGKRQKIGCNCGGQNTRMLACCSDCGK